MLLDSQNKQYTCCVSTAVCPHSLIQLVSQLLVLLNSWLSVALPQVVQLIVEPHDLALQQAHIAARVQVDLRTVADALRATHELQGAEGLQAADAAGADVGDHEGFRVPAQRILQQERQPAVAVRHVPTAVEGSALSNTAATTGLRSPLSLHQLSDHTTQRCQGLVDVTGLLEVLACCLTATMLTALNTFATCEAQCKLSHIMQSLGA